MTPVALYTKAVMLLQAIRWELGSLWNKHWLVDLRFCNVYSVSPPIRKKRLITELKLQLLGLEYRVGVGFGWRNRSVHTHTPNASYDVMCVGNLRGYEGIEVYDWSNSCNIPLPLTSAVRFWYNKTGFVFVQKMLAVLSLLALLAVLLIDLCTNIFINYVINIPILMFSFCKKMPYTPMSILIPIHLIGPNHGKRDPTS